MHGGLLGEHVVHDARPRGGVGVRGARGGCAIRCVCAVATPGSTAERLEWRSIDRDLSLSLSDAVECWVLDGDFFYSRRGVVVWRGLLGSWPLFRAGSVQRDSRWFIGSR